MRNQDDACDCIDDVFVKDNPEFTADTDDGNGWATAQTQFEDWVAWSQDRYPEAYDALAYVWYLKGRDELDTALLNTDLDLARDHLEWLLGDDQF